MFTIAPFPTLHHSTVDVRDHDLSARKIMLKLGDDGAGFDDVATNVGNGFMHTSWRRIRRFSGCTRCRP